MARIPLDKVAPGMVLAAEARDRQGRLLLAAGQELSRRTLESLRFWGVLSLEVREEGEPAAVPVAVTPEMVARAKDEVAARFLNAGPPHPYLELLRALAVERRALELAAGRAGES